MTKELGCPKCAVLLEWHQEVSSPGDCPFTESHNFSALLLSKVPSSKLLLQLWDLHVKWDQIFGPQHAVAVAAGLAGDE